MLNSKLVTRKKVTRCQKGVCITNPGFLSRRFHPWKRHYKIELAWYIFGFGILETTARKHQASYLPRTVGATLGEFLHGCVNTRLKRHTVAVVHTLRVANLSGTYVCCVSIDKSKLNDDVWFLDYISYNDSLHGLCTEWFDQWWQNIQKGVIN